MIHQELPHLQRCPEQQAGPAGRGDDRRQGELPQIGAQEAACRVGRQPQARQETADRHHLEDPPGDQARMASCRCGGSCRATQGTWAEAAKTVKPQIAQHDAGVQRHQREPRERASSTCIAAATVAASSRMKVARMMAAAWNPAAWPASASRDVIELASMA